MSDSDDPIAESVLSESVYERLRYTEGIITIPVSRVLVIQAALLAALALIWPLYALYPGAIAAHVPTLDPFGATPKLLFLGLVGWATELAAALLLAGLWHYRQRNAPLSEETARTIYDVEQIAAGLSIVTGGLAIAVTVSLVSIGVFGEAAITAYLDGIAGDDVFTQTGLGLSVGHLAMLSVLSSVLVLLLRDVLCHAETNHLA